MCSVLQDRLNNTVDVLKVYYTWLILSLLYFYVQNDSTQKYRLWIVHARVSVCVWNK